MFELALSKVVTAVVMALSALTVPAQAELHQASSTAASIPMLSMVSSPAPGVEFTNTSKGITCAFGFKAVREGVTGYITAGHCGDAGDQVAISTIAGKRAVGRFEWSLGSPLQGGSHDLAFIRIDSVVVDGAVARVGKAPSATLTREDMELAHPDLCKVGPKSGDTCGEVTPESFGPGVVNFDAPSLHGDSGSPIFARTREGEVVAVGILSGSPAGKPDTIAAQLVDVDTLDRFGLAISSR